MSLNIITKASISVLISFYYKLFFFLLILYFPLPEFTSKQIQKSFFFISFLNFKNILYKRRIYERRIKKNLFRRFFFLLLLLSKKCMCTYSVLKNKNAINAAPSQKKNTVNKRLHLDTPPYSIFMS